MIPLDVRLDSFEVIKHGSLPVMQCRNLFAIRVELGMRAQPVYDQYGVSVEQEIGSFVVVISQSLTSLVMIGRD